jgi:hypothetical protein
MNTEKKELDIKDYLHLYLGCEVEIREFSCYGESTYIEKVIQVTNEHAGTEKFEYYFDGDNEITFKPILRRLSDKNMTTDELREWCKRRQRKGWMPGVHADNTKWLLSKGFDLFGIIDSNLAIEKV